jgi:hypothetical protein
MSNDEKVNQRQHEIYNKIQEERKKITRHIDVVEHAKIIRQALKEKFPDIKFKVRTSRFAGGDSVTVYHVEKEWYHPKHNEINNFIDKFDGYRSDLMDGIYNVGFEWKDERLLGATFCSYQGGYF